MQHAVAGEIGDLEICPIELLLQGNDVVEVSLELTLVKGCRVEIGGFERRELWGLSGVIGDLVFLYGNAADRGKPGGVVKQGR
jgi:hypothetical protein